MKLEEVRKLTKCPKWLKNKNIKVKNEDIELGENNEVIWKKGIWKNGTWNNGIWHNGIWKDGKWKNGTWFDGKWNNGIWAYGIWLNGIWKDGIWQNGTWTDGTWRNGIMEYGIWMHGIWKNGLWKDGIWNNGTWINGIWEDGLWHNGKWKYGKVEKILLKINSSCRWNIFVKIKSKSETIRIGCKEKTIEEWDKFFLDSSIETFVTPRNAIEFEDIKSGYEIAKQTLKLFIKEIKEID
jgi:hypothetical protein